MEGGAAFCPGLSVPCRKHYCRALELFFPFQTTRETVVRFALV